MSVQAYWNVYIPSEPNKEFDSPAQVIAQEMDALAEIERIIASYSSGTIETTLRNLGGENLELEISGNIFRIIKFLENYPQTVRSPFLIYADSWAEQKALVEELGTKPSYQHVDILKREKGELDGGR